MSYADRLADRCAVRGRFCVGIDPHPSLLAAWAVTDDAAGLERCARGMVDALGSLVAVFKPQSALFERHGAAGIAVLERVLADIADAGALSLLDVKRGDIGSTMDAYAQAYLVDCAALSADAITVSPYLGVGALAGAIDIAVANGRGLYVLARTSNTEGAGLQLADAGGRSVAQLVVDEAAAANRRHGVDVVGLVVGATQRGLDLDLTKFTGSILMPGIGAQGARLADIEGIVGSAVGQVLPTSSRQIMAAGPDPAALRDAVAVTVAETDVLTRRDSA